MTHISQVNSTPEQKAESESFIEHMDAIGTEEQGVAWANVLEALFLECVPRLDPEGYARNRINAVHYAGMKHPRLAFHYLRRDVIPMDVLQAHYNLIFT